MDDAVRAALQRWPDVPAVAGWLSLNPRGEWRLHPNGDARPGAAGESISNTQVLAFINRNYAAEADGRWYFQNGPQKVYVTLDLAPLVVRLADDGQSLQTHHGQPVQDITAWYLGDDGRLYLQTPHGPAALFDRDLPALLPRLRTDDGLALERLLEETPESDGLPVLPSDTHLTLDSLAATRAPLRRLAASEAETLLGFVRQPGA